MFLLSLNFSNPFRKTIPPKYTQKFTKHPKTLIELGNEHRVLRDTGEKTFRGTPALI